MKALSGIFAFKFGILVVSVTASIILMSACKKSLVRPTDDRPILIIFDASGVKTTKTPDEVKDACSKLNQSGKGLCEISFYKDNREVFHEGKLTMTRAVSSEAAGNPAAGDPTHLMQRAVVDTLDTATDFLGQIK